MRGVHGLLADHIGDHSGKIMACINKLPLSPDEKVLLQAIENMQEAALDQTLQAIDKMQKRLPNQSAVKDWLDGHSKELHEKLDGHGRNHQVIAKKLAELPDHNTLMQGVHGLLADHIGDHSG